MSSDNGVYVEKDFIVRFQALKNEAHDLRSVLGDLCAAAENVCAALEKYQRGEMPPPANPNMTDMDALREAVVKARRVMEEGS